MQEHRMKGRMHAHNLRLTHLPPGGARVMRARWRRDVAGRSIGVPARTNCPADPAPSKARPGRSWKAVPAPDLMLGAATVAPTRVIGGSHGDGPPSLNASVQGGKSTIPTRARAIPDNSRILHRVCTNPCAPARALRTAISCEEEGGHESEVALGREEEVGTTDGCGKRSLGTPLSPPHPQVF